MTQTNFADQIGKILEASNVKKAMLIPYFMIAVFAQYLLFDVYFILRPSPYLNMDSLLAIVQVKIAVFIIAIILSPLGNILERSAAAQKFIPHLFSIFYVSSLMIMGYTIGHLSITIGFVMAAVPLVAIILFDGFVVVTIISVGFLWFATMSLLNVFQLIPYAPLLISSAEPELAERIFIHGLYLFFMLPYLVSFMVSTYFLVKYWRSRESDIRRMSLTDSLLAMSNRRAISEKLLDAQTHLSEDLSLSVILVDIDFFKKVNDNYGHVTGDLVLCRVGDILKKSLRASDQIGRYGGEEFLIVLPDTNQEVAKQVAERCRKELENETIWSSDQRQINVTASFGVYCTTDSTEDINSILQKVDVQLYRAKEAGRNRVCCEEQS